MPTNFYEVFAQKSLDYWYGIACAKFPKHKLTKPIIKLSKRMTRMLGMAYISKNEIRISANQLELYPRFFRDDLIPHELAHILASQIFNYGDAKGESHGEPWKKACRALGVEPIRVYEWDYIHAKERK